MKKSLLGTLVLILIVLIGVFVWSKRNWIFDEVRLYHYNPPSQIINLAYEDSFTPYGTHLFYVYHPTLEGAAQFNQDCKVTEQAIVLGCTVIGKGIWLYNVTDPSLNGVEQVTAAHEMLHVAYSRLSPSELKKVNAMVWSAYQSLAPTNPMLAQEEQLYQKTEGQGEVLNELHSVLGTEIASLPPNLESYYSQFFSNRQVIVNYANAYRNEFTSRQTIVSQDDQQLSSWKQQINSDESSLSSQLSQIQTEQSQLNNYKSSGQISDYNAGIDGYNSAVDKYNSLIDQTKQLIGSYNALVVQRNSVANSIDQLTESLSSLPSTLTTQ